MAVFFYKLKDLPITRRAMTDIPVRCSCGSFRARLSNVGPKHGIRVICYCASCQAFARYLGRADEILDPHGGSDIYQVSPGRLEILEGKDQLACVHLTEKPTLRWYANCCKTPIGNTLNTNKLPFIGLLHSCLDSSASPDGLDGLVGPVRAGVNGTDAKGDTSGLDISDSAPLSIYWRFFRLVIGTKLRGEHRKSPLFNRETGRPIVKPIRNQSSPEAE